MNNEYNMNYEQQRGLDGLNAYLSKVFAWMFGGLLLSFATAYGLSLSSAIMGAILGNRAVVIGLVVVELILVIALGRGIGSMSYGTAGLMFMIYSFINGLTLSVIFVAYQIGTISVAFLTTSLLFAAMAIKGKTTKKDLSAMGSFLFMALIGVLVASLINMFLRNSMMDLVISIVAVLVFAGLTAWDMQKIKGFYYSYGGTSAAGNLAVYGALQLYLDFINMFLRILSILGRRD